MNTSTAMKRNIMQPNLSFSDRQVRFVIGATMIAGTLLVSPTTMGMWSFVLLASIPFITMAITGPEPVNLTSAPSDANGVAEATWSTQAPNKKGVGGTAVGSYTATITGVTASGFVWDQLTTSVNFTISQ